METTLISNLMTALRDHDGLAAMLNSLETLNQWLVFQPLMVKSFMFEEVVKCMWKESYFVIPKSI